MSTKLPVGIGALLIAVTSGLIWAAYREVRRSQLETASERLGELSRQFAEMFQAAAPQRFATLRRLASDAKAAELLASPDKAARETAVAAIDKYLKTNEQTLAVELWTPNGERAFAHGREVPALTSGSALELAGSVDAQQTVAISGFERFEDGLLYRLVVATESPDAAAGYLCEVRSVANSPRAAAMITGLIGSDARLLIGASEGRWHELSREIAPPPPSALDGARASVFTLDDGIEVIGRAHAVGGSPWHVVIAFPTSTVLASARQFVGRAASLSGVVLVLGVCVAWWASRRLTKPLEEVARAAEELAAGRAAPKLDTRRSDEVGRLAASFNSMAGRVESAARRLHVQAAQYRLLFDNNPLPMWLCDAETGRFLDVNDAALRQYGYARESFLERAERDMLAVAAERSSEETVLEEHQTAEGRLIDVEVTRQPLEYDGRAAVLTLAHNVSKMVAAERSLRLSESMLQAANRSLRDRIREKTEAEANVRAREQDLVTTLDSIGDAVIATDARGAIVRMNPVAEQLTQWSAAEARGRALTEVFRIVSEDERRVVASPVERVLREGTVVGLANHTLLIARDGSDRPIADSGAPIRDADGCVRGVVLVFRDVTAEREAERALRSSEARKTAILDAALDGVITIDHEGCILEFNPAAERTFGYARADVLGKPLADLIVPARLREQHRRGLERIVRTGEGSVIGRRLELPALRADGKEFPAEISIVRIGADHPPIFTGFLRDLSDRSKLEAQLRHAQKMEAVGRLAGGVAHDFNNVLAVISGYCEMLLEDDVDDSTATGVREIRSAALRAAELTSQLLAFSRQQVLAPKVIRLNEVVVGMERMLRRLIGDDVELTLRAAPDTGAVHADVGQLEQVIMNLVLNARDAMPRGGELTIGTENVELDEDYCASHPEVKPGAFVMLAVADTGVGMDAETAARIFEPFFTTKENGKGTGLGLATVFGIVQQSGGSIWVYSEVDSGSTFKVYLPRVNAEQAAPKSLVRPERPAAAATGETVLLVEDDRQVRDVVRRMLDRQGYRVLEAPGGLEALDVCRNFDERIDLVLTDVVMPQLSGRAFVERLRGVRPDVRVLFMSGYADDALMRRGVLELGAEFVGKPFSHAALMAKVRSVLDARPAPNA